MPPRKRVAAKFRGGDRRVTLEDPEAIKVLYDPLRLKIVGLLGESRTAKEIAEAVERPLTSLYYHLNVLVEHGLVRIEEERVKGRSVERLFRRVADEFTADAEVVALVGGLAERHISGFTSVVHHLQRAFSAQEEPAAEGRKPGLRMVMDVSFGATDKEAERVMSRLRDVISECEPGGGRGRGVRKFRLVVAISPEEEDPNNSEDDRKREV